MPGSVLVVLHEKGLGGATISLLRAVPHLEQRGWEFSYWVDRPSALFDHMQATGADVDGAPRSIGFDLAWLRGDPGAIANLRALPAYRRAFRQRLATRTPALVHANSIYSLPDALIASRRVPTLLHSHEMVPSAAKAALARALSRAARLRVVGASAACAARLGPRTTVVHSSAPEPGEMPAIATNPGRRPIVATLGYICERKGSDLFVEAARICADRGVAADFRMIGDPMDGAEREWGEAVIARGTAVGVVHQPFTPAARALGEVDVLVHPARQDTFPLAVLEAMGNGLAVIASAVGGIPEQIADGAGLAVEPQDPAALADAIAGLVDDPAQRQRLGAAGRERVLANFTPAHQAEALDRVYGELIR